MYFILFLIECQISDITALFLSTDGSGGLAVLFFQIHWASWHSRCIFFLFLFFFNLALIILAFWSVNRDWSHVCFCRYSLCWERNKVRSHFFTSSITPLCPGRGGGASPWHPVSLQMHVNALFDSARPAQLFCEMLHLYINIIFYYPLLKLEEWAPSMPWWMQQSMLSCTPTTHSLLQGLASTNTCGGRSTWPQSSLYVDLFLCIFHSNKFK